MSLHGAPEPGAEKSLRIERAPSALSAAVYERLVDALLEGSLGPGDRLVQDVLATRLDVSRTPVRDALLRLHAEGVVEPSGRKGFIVRKLDDADVGRIYQAREAVEGHAAFLLAGNNAALRTAEDLVAAGESGAFGQDPHHSFELNRDIHRAIVAATGNQYLLSFFDAIWTRALAARVFRTFQSSAVLDDFVADHRDLLNAISEADPDDARKAAVSHIRRGLHLTIVAETAERRPA